MNTHKEEPKFKVGDEVFMEDCIGLVRVISSYLNTKTEKWEYDVRGYEEDSYAIEEAELSYPVEPTPPSQIEELTKRVSGLEDSLRDLRSTLGLTN